MLVVDVPGDHFSLLRQEPADMEPLVAMLKVKLGAFGWHEAVRRERRQPAARALASAAAAAGGGGGGGGGADAGAAAAREDLDDYLARMGVGDAAIRDRLASALPFSDIDRLGGGGAGGAGGAGTPGGGPLRPAHLLRPLPRAAGVDAAAASRLAPLIVVPGADPALPELHGALARLQRRAFCLELPPRRHLARLRSVPALAALFAQAVLEGLPSAATAASGGAIAIAGVGLGGAVAHELAAQLQRAGRRVDALLLVEDGALRAAADAAEQPWFRLRPLLAAWRPDADLEAFAARARLLAAQPAGAERQLDAVAAMAPEGMARADWDDLVEER